MLSHFGSGAAAGARLAAAGAGSAAAGSAGSAGSSLSSLSESAVSESVLMLSDFGSGAAATCFGVVDVAGATAALIYIIRSDKNDFSNF